MLITKRHRGPDQIVSITDPEPKCLILSAFRYHGDEQNYLDVLTH